MKYNAMTNGSTTECMKYDITNDTVIIYKIGRKRHFSAGVLNLKRGNLDLHSHIHRQKKKHSMLQITKCTTQRIFC